MTGTIDNLKLSLSLPFLMKTCKINVSNVEE
jgi:hypothetical protein